MTLSLSTGRDRIAAGLVSVDAVLLKKSFLDSVLEGKVDLVFRSWKRPTVRTGGTLRTAIGLLEIVSVEIVDPNAITEEECRRAGVDLDDLLRDLASRPDGDVYRVHLGQVLPDPRDELRSRSDLSESDFADVLERLARLDRASERGPWTRDFLGLISDQPKVRAQDLADEMGLPKQKFKDDVRKLKNLGLTISHSPGYELSPRGEAVLAKLRG